MSDISDQLHRTQMVCVFVRQWKYSLHSVHKVPEGMRFVCSARETGSDSISPYLYTCVYLTFLSVMANTHTYLTQKVPTNILEGLCTLTLLRCQVGQRFNHAQ